MAILSMPDDITSTGMSHGGLFTILTNLVTVVNELVDDHATSKTHIDEIDLDYEALLVDAGAIRTALVAITAQLDLDSGVNDTTYASGNDPAALTATSIAATTTATLTNATDLTLSD